MTEFEKALQKALDAPLLPEQRPSLPDDPGDVAIDLRAITDRTQERAGSTMDLIKEAARRYASGTLGPWND